jgi:phage FluMu protein Com
MLSDKIDLVDLVPLTIKFQGRALDIKKRRPMFAPIFKRLRSPKKIVYLCGRQIGKTTSIGGSILMDCLWRDHFNCLYVSPMSIYTQRMHSVFMLPMIRGCMLPWKIQNTTDCINNVLEKSFLTGSHYFGISAYNSAAQALGLSRIDSLVFDEAQDFNADFIPQIREVSGASDYRFESYFGTARSVDNTLTLLFENSTQNFWHMKCPHCGHENIPNLHGDVLSMIQKQGISCVKCGKLLDVDHGRFVRSYEYDQTHRDAEGYHVPQIIVKDRITPHERYIETIYNKLHGSSAYSESRFLQEILGIPTSQGGKPITQEDIKAACILDIPKDKIPSIQKYQRVAGGVDWGGSEITSFTVGCIVAYRNGVFDVLGAIRPTGLPDEQRHIVVGKYFNTATSGAISIVGGDAGFVGSVQNPNLGQVMGKQVASISYGTTKRFLSPRPYNHFTVDRTTLLYIVFTLIKQKKIRFPAGDWFDVFTRDILAIYTEDVVNSQGTTMRRYARYSDRPDDFVHALGYGLLMCSLGIVDLPEMVGMQSDTSINAPYVSEIGVEMGYSPS